MYVGPDSLNALQLKKTLASASMEIYWNLNGTQ